MQFRASGVALVDCLCGGVARGLPLAISGPTGSGRTVLALQLARGALDNGAVVAYLCNEPAALLLQQAETLGLGLAAEVASGRLALLVLDERAPLSVRAHGLAAPVDAVRREVPNLTTLIIDPLTALSPELLEEAVLRREARAFAQAASGFECAMTLEAERLEQAGGLARVFAEICGAWIELERSANGERVARRVKSRGGAIGTEELRFAIGARGADAIAPRVDSAQATSAGPALAAPAPDLARPRVLLAVAQPEARERMRGWLARSCDVSCAADGVEALTSLLGSRPDLAILDLALPKVPGLEVLAALQKSGARLRTLALAPKLERAGDRLAPLVLGATDVIASPADSLELLHKVRLLLQLGAPPARLMDPGDAVALFGQSTPSRELDAPGFRERLSRACAFGAEHGYASSLIAVVAETPRALDGLLLSADRWLRFEDASLRLSPTRALILLVAARPEEAAAVMERLCEGSATESRSRALRSRISEAEPLAQGESWARYFASADSGATETSR
jgi:CheY-like chemotaxis protein